MDFNVGDYAWFIKSFEELDCVRIKPAPITRPIGYKIIHVEKLKDGIMYQTRKGHFHENWIGKIVFYTKEEAMAKMKEK